MDIYPMQGAHHRKKGSSMTRLIASINISPYTIMIALLSLSVVIVVIFILLYQRHLRHTKESETLRNLTKKAIDLCGLSVLRYNIKEDLLTSSAHLVIPKEGLSMYEIMEHIHRRSMMPLKGRLMR